jgi:hypothetical protein
MGSQDHDQGHPNQGETQDMVLPYYATLDALPHILRLAFILHGLRTLRALRVVKTVRRRIATR